jgi:predicted DCC family thiol-disulfide oxidoreductase YuxK
MNDKGIHKYSILFDGSCLLCNRWVRWIKKCDHRNSFIFLMLQSVDASGLLNAQGDHPLNDTVILLYRDEVFERSDAILKILSILGYPLKLLTVLRFIPRSLRDGLYNFVARNRHRWFGKTEVCQLSESGKPCADLSQQ